MRHRSTSGIRICEASLRSKTIRLDYDFKLLIEKVIKVWTPAHEQQAR